MLIRVADRAVDVPGVVEAVCEELQVKDLFYNLEYEVDESRRDLQVTEMVEMRKIKVHTFHDQCIVVPGMLRSKSADKTYTVYSPFKNQWFDLVKSKRKLYLTILDLNSIIGDEKVNVAHSRDPDVVPDAVSDDLTDAKERAHKMTDWWPSGETEAMKRLHTFGNSKAMHDYSDKRNFPALNGGTSALSPYLAAGVLSPKLCVTFAASLNQENLNSGSQGFNIL